MTEQCCGRCKHARLPLTAHKPPRVRKDRYGHCAAPPIQIKATMLPICTGGDLNRRAIFASQGQDCKAFEPGKPQDFTGQNFPAVEVVEC